MQLRCTPSDQAIVQALCRNQTGKLDSALPGLYQGTGGVWKTRRNYQIREISHRIARCPLAVLIAGSLCPSCSRLTPDTPNSESAAICGTCLCPALSSDYWSNPHTPCPPCGPPRLRCHSNSSAVAPAGELGGSHPVAFGDDIISVTSCGSPAQRAAHCDLDRRNDVSLCVSSASWRPSAQASS